MSPEILQFAPLILVFAIMYFLIIRPQQQKVKQHQAAVSAVKRGDTVVTGGGVIGRVVKVKDDNEIVVEIADNVQIRVVKATLSEVRPKASVAAAANDKSDDDE